VAVTNTRRASAVFSSVYHYALRVEAYVGLLTGAYPPFQLAA
jgi:hypothetical protein